MHGTTVYKKKNFVVFFILGDPPESEFYVPTFRNNLFHFKKWCKQEGTYTTYEDGTDRVFLNVDTQNSDTGGSPKTKNKTFRKRRKFEIKVIFVLPRLTDNFKAMVLSHFVCRVA